MNEIAQPTGVPTCFENHHKYVGKCPYCHTELPEPVAQPTEAGEAVAWQYRWRDPKMGWVAWHDGKIPANPYKTFGTSWTGEEFEFEERALVPAARLTALTARADAAERERDEWKAKWEAAGSAAKRHLDARVAAERIGKPKGSGPGRSSKGKM